MTRKQQTRKVHVQFALVVMVLIFSLQALFADPVRGVIDRNLVGFIFDAQAETNSFAIGTGFFIGIPTKADPVVSTVYLVTSKHVLLNETGKAAARIYVRMNAKKGGFYNLFLPFEGPQASLIFTNSDPTVDIAVVPLAFDFASADISFLPSKFIATREAYKGFSIREGDEMFFLGLFTPFYGSKHNLPIFRFGRLSMLSDEKIPFGYHEEDLLLMETQVFGGNSGAPCFFYFDERRNPNDTKILLAGVVKGFFRDWSEVRLVDTKQTPISSNNVGISAVTPGYYILDILQNEQLQKMRDGVDQLLLLRYKTNSPPTAEVK